MASNEKGYRSIEGYSILCILRDCKREEYTH